MPPSHPISSKKSGIDSILGSIVALSHEDDKLPKVNSEHPVHYAGPGFGGPGSAGPPGGTPGHSPATHGIKRHVTAPSGSLSPAVAIFSPPSTTTTASSKASVLPNVHKAGQTSTERQIAEQQAKFLGGGQGPVDNTTRILKDHQSRGLSSAVAAAAAGQSNAGDLSSSSSTTALGQSSATTRGGRRRSSFGGAGHLERIESGMDLLTVAANEGRAAADAYGGGGGTKGGGGGVSFGEAFDPSGGAAGPAATAAAKAQGKRVGPGGMQLLDDPFETLRKIKEENEKVAALEKSRKEARMRKTLGAGSVAFDVAPTPEELKELGKEREKKIDSVKNKRNELEQAKHKSVMSNIEDRERHKIEQEEKRALQSVQRKVLSYIVLGALTTRWITQGRAAVQHWHSMKGLHKAARKIQRCIRNFLAVRNARAARYTRKLLKSVWWRARLWIRAVRRRLAARRLRVFFEEFSVQQVAYIIFTFRYRVIAVQKIIRSFLACKRSRRILLEKMWHKLEKKIAEVKSDIPPSSSHHNSKQHAHDSHNLSAMGGRLAAASARYNDIEKMLGRKKAALAGAVGAENDTGIVDTTSKGVDLRIMKYLVRVHLEERRYEHTKKVAKYFAAQDSAPQINADHARQLLAGNLLHVENVVVKKRPVFSLFKGYKQKFVEIIEEAIKDEKTVLARVEDRKTLEAQMLMSSRYGKDDITSEEDEAEEKAAADKAAEEVTEEEEEEEETMTPEQEAQENVNLAKSFNTTPDKIQEVREMFQLVDLDHGGSIDANEFGKLLELLGMQRSQEEIQEMVDKIDTTGQGEVFFPDFVKALKSHRPNPNYTEEAVQGAFKFFALKGQQKEGFILKTHLISALTTYKGKWTLDKAENTLHDAGLSQSAIDYRTYVHVMFQLCLQ